MSSEEVVNTVWKTKNIDQMVDHHQFAGKGAESIMKVAYGRKS